jgi:hypothetical protein
MKGLPRRSEQQNTFLMIFEFPTKLLDQVTLDGLFSLMDPTSPGLEAWWEVPLYGEEELWVYQLPPYFIEKLAHLLESERSRLAKQWGQTEELRAAYAMIANPKRQPQTGKLEEICAFASEATERGKHVFLRAIL